MRRMIMGSLIASCLVGMAVKPLWSATDAHAIAVRLTVVEKRSLFFDRTLIDPRQIGETVRIIARSNSGQKWNIHLHEDHPGDGPSGLGYYFDDGKPGSSSAVTPVPSSESPIYRVKANETGADFSLGFKVKEWAQGDRRARTAIVTLDDGF